MLQRKSFWPLCMLIVLALAQRAALSEPAHPEWYADFTGDALYASDLDVYEPGLTGALETETGFIVSGVATSFLPQFRAEGELFYFENEFGGPMTQGTGLPFSGDQSSFGGMASLYYDFVTGGRWQPYVGLGVGYLQTSIDAFAPGALLGENHDSAIAYQFRAGFTIPYSANTDFLFGYRYWGSEDFTFRDSNGGSFTAEGFESHAIEGRFRFRF